MLVGHIPVRRPFPWSHLLRYLSHRMIPEVEQVENDRYVRRAGTRDIEVSFDAAGARLRIEARGRLNRQAVMDRIESLFDVDHDATGIRRHLRRSALLEPLLARVSGMRPVGAWSPFELCVRTIIGQQVSVAAAGTLMRRLVQRCGSMTPECVVAANLSSIGMPGKRVEAIRSFSQALAQERIDFTLPWTQIDAALKELPGFGPWTRAYLAIRLGRDPDAFPATDIGLMRAANVRSSAELLSLAEAWRPYRAYAATYLWAVEI